MTTPTTRNRLDEEASPYLQQHADNPVNWQPWDEQALEAARERDVPIFLSVGYSACHWCHVMEEESFQDEAIAELLNEQFVPIKVDREERPDVDSIYQTVCQVVTGRGGWPLSAWLTPEGEPFYVGTYFPDEPKRGAPAFPDLLEQIADAWESDRESIEERAAEWTRAARDQLEAVPEPAGAGEGGPGSAGAGTGGPGDADADGPEPADADEDTLEPDGVEPSEDALEIATRAALRSADREHGGFGRGPKFPQPARLDLLVRAADRTGRDPPRAVLVETLDAMADRGMYDHVGGGFHRYATDRDWTVPHFEKMLYDNAELPRVYLEGYRLTGDERYAEVAAETFAFLDRELSHPDGGFYSTLDARSETPASRRSEGEAPEHEEGAFYVWTPGEVRDALEDDFDADLVCERFGVTERGNFEGGTTVLTIARSVADLADEHDLPGDEVRERLDTATERLREVRDDRPRPNRDEKVLAGWNGLAVSALAEGHLTLDGDDAASHAGEDVASDADDDAAGDGGDGGVDDHAARAAEAVDFLREHLWDADERLLKRRYRDGDVGVDGYLEDYAFLARGALDLYGVTGDVEHLAFALDLGRAIRERFWDAEAGTLYFTDAAGEELVVRPQEARDQSTPSSLGVALAVLLTLDHFVPGEAFADVVERTLEAYAGRVRSNPMEHATIALVADRSAAGDPELTVAADELPAAWRETLGRTSLPGRILAPRPPTEDGLASWLETLELGDPPPVWAGREARDGVPTVYACRSYACSPPETDLAAALAWLRENASPDVAW